MGMDCAGVPGAASDGAAAELALAVGDRAPWAPALDGLALNVPAGGRICVMGASGAGKSTLLALAAGESAPCSMVFQDARLVESASALDNVLVCADARVDASNATTLLRRLVPGIDVHARVVELSGGQRHRVEIARALLCPGGAVILDEPFTGLDTAARDAWRRGRARPARRPHAPACHTRRLRRSSPRYLGHHHALNTNSATK